MKQPKTEFGSRKNNTTLDDAFPDVEQSPLATDRTNRSTPEKNPVDEKIFYIVKLIELISDHPEGALKRNEYKKSIQEFIKQSSDELIILLIEKLRVAAKESNQNWHITRDVDQIPDTFENTQYLNTLNTLSRLQKKIIYKNGANPPEIKDLLLNQESSDEEISDLIFQAIDGFDSNKLETIKYSYDQRDINYLNLHQEDLVSGPISLENLLKEEIPQTKFIPIFYQHNNHKEWLLIYQDLQAKKITIYHPCAEFSSDISISLESFKKEGFEISIISGVIEHYDSGPVINDLIKIYNQNQIPDDNILAGYQGKRIADIRLQDITLKQQGIRGKITRTAGVAQRQNPIIIGAQDYIRNNSLLLQIKNKKAEKQAKQPIRYDIDNDNISGIFIAHNEGGPKRKIFNSDSAFAKLKDESSFSLTGEDKRVAGAFIKSKSNDIKVIKESLTAISEAIVEAANYANSLKANQDQKLTQKDIITALTFAHQKGGLSNKRVTQEMRDVNNINQTMYSFSNEFQKILARSGTVLSAQDQKTGFRTKRVGDIFGGSNGISDLVGFINKPAAGVGYLDKEDNFTIINQEQLNNFIDQVANRQSVKGHGIQTPITSVRPKVPTLNLKRISQSGEKRISSSASQASSCASR